MALVSTPALVRSNHARLLRRRTALFFLLGSSALFPLGLTACGSRAPKIVTQVDVTELPPGKVPGVNRYCWVQPKVVREANGPGLNAEGTYYQPAYTAVREVKQGRWKNCETGEPVKPE
jgi:hypothetical protein